MQFSVLVRGEDCGASHHGPGVLAFSFGLWGRGEKKRFYLLKQRVASNPPCFLFILFQKPLFFFSGIKSYLLPPDLYVFELGSAKARHLFLEYFHFRYPVKIFLVKGLLFEPFQRSWLRRSGVLGIPTNSVGT